MKVLKQIFTIALMAVSAFSFAQKASMKGSITELIDGKSQGVPFANVAILEGFAGTTTDFDGKYVIEGITPGTKTLVVSFIGFKSDTLKVVITPGQVLLKNVTLGQNSEMLKEFEVTAKQNRESVNVLLMDQKNASEIKQTIGAQELSKKGASDVAAGLSKVTGVTIVAGRDMFVRGLGDRYNMATFNGGAIASPNPDLKVIPLDIFPTDVVQSLSIDKVFVPRYFADYAGAKIDIVSKDYPEEAFFKVELGTSINSITTFKDFRTRKDGNNEYLGFDGSGRGVPAVIASNAKYDGFSSSVIEDQTYPYSNTGTNISTIKAAPSTSLAWAGGNYYVVGENSGIGFFATAKFSNNYQNNEGSNRVLKADRAPITDYTQTESIYSTNSMFYGSIFYKINKRNNISYNVLAVNTSETPTSDNEGFNNDQGYSLLTTRNTHFQNKMMNHQLIGKHILADRDKWVINWNATFSVASNQEKDRTQLVWQEVGSGYKINALDLAANHRFWSDLNENQYNGGVEIERKFKYLSETNDNSNQGRVYAGLAMQNKSRSFDWRQINYQINNPAVSGNPLLGNWDVNDPDAMLSQENFEAGYYDFKEQKDPSSTYFAELNVQAAYINADYYVIPNKLQFQIGARIEASKQSIRYKKLSDLFDGPYQVSQIDTINIFPVIGSKYVINDNSNLRFSASQTVTRPLFREVAPFQYLPYFGGIQEEGNVNLKNAYNYNVDLKYEFFPNLGEMMAVTVFGKYLDSPIERVQIASSTPLATYINTDKAYAGGVEFEITKNLGNLVKADSGWTRNMFLGFNASYLYTEISIDTANKSKGAIVVTNPKRALQGASPFLINADLTYRVNFKKMNMLTDFTATYNVFGKRIYTAGVQGLPDIYEMPVNTVDLIIKNQIGENFTVDFKVANLLNPEIKYQQDFSDQVEVTRAYKRGVTYSLKLGYMF